ncbi:hypothetical protein ACLKA7_013790 [Drosophila subpalustris]
MERQRSSLKRKSSKRKRKTQTSRIYRRTEREVQLLLSQCRLRASQDFEVRSLQFFHGTGIIESGSSELDDTGKSKSGEDDSATGATSSSGFIEIDLSDPPLVTPRSCTQHHCLDNVQLYVPSGRLHLPLHFNDCEIQLERSQIRMLNRYQEEAKTRSGNGKLSPRFIAELTENALDSGRFIIDATLYRSNCGKRFKSVFLVPAPLSEFHGLPTRRVLRLSLKQLRFTAHPQLLEEHRLSQQLEDIYDVYIQHVNNQICHKLRQELQMARHVAARLLQAADVQQQQTSDSQLTAHIQRQLRLAQQLRTRYYAESTAQRTLLQQLLTQWAKLKELRKRQQFQCTRFQLSLRLIQPADLDASCSAWKERFETDLAEVYREHLEAYYRRQRFWSEQLSPQSKPPRKPRFDEIMDSLKRQYERAFQDPEEPEVHVLHVPADESTLSLQSNNEQVHKGRNYFLKIYLDNQFVAQTRSYRLEPDLHVHMNENIGVLLDRSLPAQINIWGAAIKDPCTFYATEEDLEHNQKCKHELLLHFELMTDTAKLIRYSLYEKSTVTSHSRRLALISAPLAGSEFVGAQQKRGFQVASSSGGLRPKLAGDLYLHVDYRCTDGASGHDLDDIQSLPDALCQALLPSKLAARTTDLEAKVTPRPPCGVRHKSKSSSGRGQPLIFAEHELQLCSVEELLKNRRFQLLHSRHQQRNLHTKQLRFVPALEHEVAELEEPIDSAGQLLDPGTSWDPIDLHKHRGRKYIQLLYETITSQCVQRAKTLKSTLPMLQLFGVDGVEQGTGWTALWRALCSFFSRFQAAPLREPTWQPQPQSPDGLQQFNVSLHVVRATGVPVRSRHILNVEQRQGRRRSSAGTGTGSDLNASLFVTQTLMYSNVRPFVTLSYGQRLCRSSTAEGSNPTWNEQLQLQLTGHPSDLRDDIKISLFDEFIEQQYTDEAADLYQRVQCNWLGEYRIPLSRLLTNRKFEGCIELFMPKVLVGYKRPLIDSVTNISVDQYPEFKESVHLWFYLSIEPGCELTPIQVGGLACAELPELQQFLGERCLELQQLLPQTQRYVDPLVCTSHGKRVCLTRLLEPVPLPLPHPHPHPPSTPTDNQVESVCRFVSLLSPLRTYMDACQSFQGVWLDNQTMLDCTWCSAKDLGVLLCNFMLSLGLECWLLLGLACPYGECTFVIYRQPETAELLLVDPTTGKRYQHQDVFCPLTRVYCIVGTENIYFNIQAESRVSMTNFNMLDGASWLPLFNKRQPAPQGGVHKLDYVYKLSYDLTQLQKHIERKIMKKISAWRTTRKTIWNRAFQTRLLRILSDMEKLATFPGSRYDEPAYSEELEREYPNFRLYGFTINFAYTNLAAISERIRTTCIHYNNNTQVEFCVAVHINPYANDVLSVWVFLLSIVPLVV